jgi:hypothetical protein
MNLRELNLFIMKYLRFLIIAFLIVANLSVVVAQDDPKTMAVPEGKSIIYLIRSRDGYGFFHLANKIDDVVLPTLFSRNFTYIIVDPGDHKVWCKGSARQSELVVKTEAGKKYYVLQVVSSMYGAFWANLSLMNNQKAEKFIKDCIEAKPKEEK